MRRRAVAAAAVLAATLWLSACDTPAQYSAVKLMVLVHPDGTGEMSWQVPARVSDQQVDDYGRQFAEALGLPAPQFTDMNGPARLSGLPHDHLDIEFEPFMALVRREWPDAANSVFVSLCVPHADGSASGRRVDLAHYDSCALFIVDGSGPATGIGRSARITFEGRLHPAVWHGLWLCLVVAAGVGAALFIRRHRGPWRVAAGAVAGLAPFACLWIAFRSVVAASDAAEPWGTWDTGQEFDQGFDGPFRMMALAGVIAAAVVVVVYLALRDRRRADRPNAENPVGPQLDT